MGATRKRVPKCLKRPKTTYTTIVVAEKQFKRSKKGPFSLYIGSPLVPPRKWNLWGPEGKVPSSPPPPSFSSHACGVPTRCQRRMHRHWRIQGGNPAMPPKAQKGGTLCHLAMSVESGGTGDASPAVEKSAGDVPLEMMTFQHLFS